jgi:hypothetical protein
VQVGWGLGHGGSAFWFVSRVKRPRTGSVPRK